MTPSAGEPPGPSAARRFGESVRVARRPGVLGRELGDETILLDPDRGTYYSLNEVGSRIWELATEAPTVEEILRRLVSEYVVDEATLASDVDALLGRLADEGLVEISEGRGGGRQP
jgi:hypothetical protein